MGSSNIRLYDHIKIDKETAQKLFSEYDSKIEVENLRLIPEGLSTSNYIVDIKNSFKEYLLKIYPENGGNSAVEVASYRYAKSYINVPEIYWFDDSKKVFDRHYVIMEYINGISLKEYIANNKRFPEKMAYAIGSNLALLHRREYRSMALLNSNLDIEKTLLPVTDLHEYYLNGYAGKHIDINVKDELLEFIALNRELIRKLETAFVYSHGDFNSNNILINNIDKSVWFIDFEYSLAAPIYYDIGKFFRENALIDKYRIKSVYYNFINGYNTHAKNRVSSDWIKLAKLMDMTGMLGLINKENPPKEWVKEIESAIVHSMRILNDEVV